MRISILTKEAKLDGQVNRKCLKKLYRLYGKRPRVLDAAAAAALRDALCQQRALAADMLHAFRQPRDPAAQPYRAAVERLACAMRVLDDYLSRRPRATPQQHERVGADAGGDDDDVVALDGRLSRLAGTPPEAAAPEKEKQWGHGAVAQPVKENLWRGLSPSSSTSSSAGSASTSRDSLFAEALAEVRKRVSPAEVALLPQSLLREISGLLGDRSGAGSSGGLRGIRERRFPGAH